MFGSPRVAKPLPLWGRSSVSVKLTACLLTFLFILGPQSALTAAAATATDSSTAPSAAAPSDTEPAPSEAAVLVQPDASNETSATDSSATPASTSTTPSTATDSAAPLATDSAASATTSSTTSSSNSSPQGSAGVPRQVLPEPDPATGALVYRYPLVVPPGRNGLTPDLALTYNSQSAEEGSLFGYGWSISIPYIQRVNKHGTDQLYTLNDFTSTLSGELVDMGGGSFVAKVDSGDYLKYTFAGNSWVVVDKKGTTYKFGATVQARQDNSADTTKVFSWMLEEVRDTNSNYVRYEYVKDQGQIYPSRITYTGSGAADGPFTIEFLRELRTDLYTSYRSAFAVTTRYRSSAVQVKFAGQLVRNYQLVYGTGSNRFRSLLISITETGYNDSGVATSQPPTTFTYSQSMPAWQNDTSWYYSNQYSNVARLGNANQDAYLDILTSHIPGSPWPAAQVTDVNNTRNGWQNTGAPPPPPIAFTRGVLCGWSDSSYESEGVLTDDFNGDQLIDIVQKLKYVVPPSSTFQYLTNAYLNSGGQAWVQAPAWNPALVLHTRCYIDAVIEGDFNGDSLPDIYKDGLNATTDGLQLNTGAGFAPPRLDWSIPSLEYVSDHGRLVDVNRDGLIDGLREAYAASANTSYPAEAYLNVGTGSWTASTAWKSPLDFTNNGVGDSGVKFADINADGLVDMLQISPTLNAYSIYLNTGNGWVQRNDLLPPNPSAWGERIQMVDINADGLVDIVRLGSPSTFYLGTGKVADLLERITYSPGGSAQVMYKSSAQYRDANLNILNPKLPFVLQTVNQITTNDGFGNTSTNTYTYAGGEYYYASAFDRKFAGFTKIIKTDAAGNTTTTYYHQGNATNAVQGEFDDQSAKIGYPYRVEQRDATGNVYSVAVTKWDKFDRGSGASFVKKARATTLTYDGNATHRDTAEEYAYDNATGNLTSRTQWGEVQALDDGSFTDLGSDKLTTSLTYTTGGTSGVVGLTSTTVTLDQASAKVAETRSYYDTLALGLVGKGNATKAEQWVSGSTYLNTQRTYNSYGLVTQELDARGKPTSYVYDTYNLYPATVTNAFNQAARYVYDYSVGKPTQVTDVNGYVTKVLFDGLDRVTAEQQPDAVNPATLVTKTAYVYTDTPLNVSVKKTDYLDATTAVDSYVYADGLGRSIQARTEAETAGQFSVADTIYNSLGQVLKTTAPYFSSGSARTAPTVDAALYTTYAYDAVGRATSAANAVGTVVTAYDDWKTTTTDARGNQKSLTQNAYGNLVRVDEPGGGITTYTYSALGNLTIITDASGNVRAFTYDALGRRLTAQDLHMPADSTFGTWTYAYDANGNLVTKLDPKGQTTAYIYDDLNRTLTEDFTGAAGTEATYTYDSCTNGVGRLCSVVSTAVSQAEQYDALGRVTQESKTIAAVPYVTSYTYDWQGNQLILTNPDSSQVKYLYNTAGQLESVQRKENTDAAFLNVVTSFDYGPPGAATSQVNANGTTTTNTYDAAKLYRLQRKLTANSSGSRLQDTSYTYDVNGNITRLVDASQTNAAKTVDYTYDALNRLLTATATAAANGQNYNQSYTYDSLGNILTRAETIGTNPTATYTYTYAGNQGISYANPHAVTSLSNGTSTVTYIYDANGNLTSEGSKTYAWDYANRLVQADVPGAAPVPVTASFYPAAGDGSIAYQSSTSWSTTRSVATGSAASVTGTTLNVDTGVLNGGKFQIERAFVPFDTVSLPDNATVASAKLKLYVAAKLNSDNDGQDFITVVQGLEPSITSFTTADYDLAGTINVPQEGVDVAERKDITSVTTGAYLMFNLNAAGLGWVSKVGPTKLALREGHDVLDTPFVGTKNQFNQLQIRTSEYSGTTNDPVLEVTYTLPPPVVTSTYAYDAAGQRVKVVSGGVTTVYPSASYNTDGTTAQKHIMAGSAVVATIKGTGAGATAYYVATDHLTGSNIVTSSTGVQQELTDYYPFGSIRLDEKTGTFSEQRKFTGQEYDVDTGLSYMNARYYNGTIGRFISQDPLSEVTGGSSADDWLADPQQQNSYSYARNNPLSLFDPTGQSSAVAYPRPKEGWHVGDAMGQFNGVTAYNNGRAGSEAMAHSCVDYAKRYEAAVYGMREMGVVGNPNTMWDSVSNINKSLSGSDSPYTLEQHVNGSGFILPTEGDLLIWTDNSNGHIMVVTESSFNTTAGAGYVEIIDQNGSNNTAVRRLNVRQNANGYSIMHPSRNASGEPIQLPVAGWLSPVDSSGRHAPPVGASASANSASATPPSSSTPWYQSVLNSVRDTFQGLFKQ